MGHRRLLLGALLALFLGNVSFGDDASDQIPGELQDSGGSGIAFDGASQHLVTWSDHSAQVWVRSSLQPAGPKVTSHEPLTTACLDSAGKMLITASETIASVWDVASGRETVLLWHHRGISHVCFDKSSSIAVTVGGGVIRAWSLPAGDQIWTAQYARSLLGAELVAGDKRLLAITYDESHAAKEGRTGKPHPAYSGSALLFDATTGQIVNEFGLDLAPEGFVKTEACHPAAITSDGKKIALRVLEGIEVVDLLTGRPVQRHTDCNEAWAHDYPIIGGRPIWLAFFGKNDGLISLGPRNEIVRWDQELRQPSVYKDLAFGDWTTAGVAASTSRLLLADKDAEILVVDMLSNKMLLRLPQTTKHWTVPKLSPDGACLAAYTATTGKTVLWNLDYSDRGR